MSVYFRSCRVVIMLLFFFLVTFLILLVSSASDLYSIVMLSFSQRGLLFLSQSRKSSPCRFFLMVVWLSLTCIMVLCFLRYSFWHRKIHTPLDSLTCRAQLYLENPDFLIFLTSSFYFWYLTSFKSLNILPILLNLNIQPSISWHYHES